MSPASEPTREAAKAQSKCSFAGKRLREGTCSLLQKAWKSLTTPQYFLSVESIQAWSRDHLIFASVCSEKEWA